MSEQRERPPRIQVQALAEELGIEVRELIAAARELKIDAQNRITKLHINDANRLRAHFAAKPDDDAGDDSGSIDTDEE